MSSAQVFVRLICSKSVESSVGSQSQHNSFASLCKFGHSSQSVSVVGGDGNDGGVSLSIQFAMLPGEGFKTSPLSRRVIDPSGRFHRSSQSTVTANSPCMSAARAVCVLSRRAGFANRNLREKVDSDRQTPPSGPRGSPGSARCLWWSSI